MPTFQGVVSEEQVVQLMAYLKSLSSQPASSPARCAGNNEIGHRFKRLDTDRTYKEMHRRIADLTLLFF